MKNNLITVVVPVYNMGHLLGKSINCLLSQTYENYEILIINDGSTDNSGTICDELAKKDNRIRVIHKENGGISSARNCGIENAKGEYIIFPDPDDWVEKDYLERFIDLQTEYKTDVEICGHFVDDDKKSVIHNKNATKSLLNKESAINILMRPDGFCGFSWNKLYHLDIIKENDLRFDEELGMAQDLHFTFRYLVNCDKVVYDPTPTYHYFQHIGGVTNKKSPLTKRKISGLKTYEKIAELAGDKYPKAQSSAFSTLFNMSMHFIYVYYETKMQDKELLKKLKGNLKTYKKYFFNDDRYSKSHKMLGRIALVSSKLYYLTKKLLKG